MCTGFDNPTVAVAFHPLRFKSKLEGGSGERHVFAVASTDMVAIYDTEEAQPVWIVQNLHCSQITDVCWVNALCLVVCSTDGFCSVVGLDEGDLVG